MAISYEQKKVLFLSSLGGVLEYYDFIIYVFLATFLEKLFFASGSQFVSSLKTFIVFSIGYFFRPLGGIIFSHFGDRYGRKTIFLLTILFMAVPAFVISLLPTESQIGVAAPILLLFMRIFQGLALGGEIPAAITFVAEHSSQEHRAFSTASLFFGINMGLLLGSLVTAIITTLLSNEDMFAYGWRIPFFIGGIFGLIAVFLRQYLHETTSFAKLKASQIERVPLLTVLKNYWKIVLQAACLVALSSVTIVLYLYWPQYLHQFFGFELSRMLTLNSFAIGIFSFAILWSGALADRFGYRLIYAIGAILLIIFGYPLFLLYGSHNFESLVIGYIIFSIIFGFLPGAYPAILSTLFPTQIRYSGVAISYNIGMALVAGLTPTIFTIIIYYYSTMAPAFYLILVAIIALLACLFGKYKNETF